MSRETDQCINDILQAIDRCQRYVGSLEHDDVAIVLMAEDAIERNLQIIGEAANHLSTQIRGAHPEIAWPQIRGFRNILVHQYFGVEIDVVRDGVMTHLPPLGEALAQHASEPDSGSAADGND